MDDPLQPVDDPRLRNPAVMTTQIVIAGSLGFSAFIAFCILRTQWPDLYAARISHHPGLPPLPKSFFGWIPVLYNITEEQILEHAGLDAFVFLGFFSMTIKLLSVCTFFAIAVISPLRMHFTGVYDEDHISNVFYAPQRKMLKIIDPRSLDAVNATEETTPADDAWPDDYESYLWFYVIFAYIFTFLTSFFLLRQTHHIVRVRQSYLGSQSSITDRTIRLSGVPTELRSEEALKDHIESLGIGQVRSVTICRQWKELDKLMDRRRKMLCKVERAWTEYFGSEGVKRSARSIPDVNSLPQSPAIPLGSDDNSLTPLLTSGGPSTGDAMPNVINGPPAFGRRRPLLRTGFLGLFGKHVDKIDFYTAKLEKLDQQVKMARHKEYKATPVAFVTMDTVASAQMAAQAVLDPRAYRLIAHNAPAPHDVIWRNLYKSRAERLFRQWIITVIISISTVALVFPVASLSAFLDVKSIEKFWPGLANVLNESRILNALVTGFLPTLLFTLLNVIVPFLYNGLSNLQGYLSHGDVELSVVGKNFFYIFVNLFLLFTIAGTASMLWSILKDTTKIAYVLARSLQKMALFYVDLIILQGIGMIPFRLLEFGVVFKYPFIKFFSKTPRDFHNLHKPPNFNYGFFLPQPLFILIICLSYSAMSTKILTFGLVYFVFGYFTFKYQLMYSMTHPQHSTGKSWPMIFFRVCVGLLIFHLTVAGTLALQKAFYLAVMLIPLPIATLIMMYNFYDHYLPLSYFIALRAIKSGTTDESAGRAPTRTLDEERERDSVYINPNLVSPLEDPWIADESGRSINVHFD
ncbi:hypothetical protein BZA70DRAFT_236793 [Myxozyma melibiosi]|uniref:DUF221-domain-containing protein n=1 Tax=Myxozyma melibiosi TaxID=54550 RepID=A0ABR1F978_9ASCO